MRWGKWLKSIGDVFRRAGKGAWGVFSAIGHLSSKPSRKKVKKGTVSKSGKKRVVRGKNGRFV